jgi:hypothetical protein
MRALFGLTALGAAAIALGTQVGGENNQTFRDRFTLQSKIAECKAQAAPVDKHMAEHLTRINEGIDRI